MVVELNRRLVKGYTRYKDDPRIVNLKKSVMSYNKELLSLNIRDHQVEKVAKLPTMQVIGMLVWRLLKLITLSLMTLPGLTLFAPVFLAGKLISIKKSKEALAASTVKVNARDVMATWKLLVALGLAPTLYWIYTLILLYYTYKNRFFGLVPTAMPLWLVFIVGYATFSGMSYAALRIGEVGMDVAKSLLPLVVALSPASGNQLAALRERRIKLSAMVTDLINTLGPEVFPDFNSARIIADPFDDPSDPRTKLANGNSHNQKKKNTPYRIDTSSEYLKKNDDTDERKTPDSARPHSSSLTDASIGGASSNRGHLPRNESFRNLSSIALFASHPASPHHSRSRSRSSSDGHLDGSAANGSGAFGGSFGGLQGMSPLDSKESRDEISRKIRGAMKERSVRRVGGHRRGKSSDDLVAVGSDYESSGVTTPTSVRSDLEMSRKDV